ncbi:nucleoside deaminase [bacterium]|nr:nucleoside deaminase [bacterium]
MNIPLSKTFALPEWISPFVNARDQVIQEDPLSVAIELSHENVKRRTGGPFGSLITDAEGSLVSAGVNIVVPGQDPLLHGEVVAISLAAQAMGSFDLSSLTLFTSSQPCAMCAGAIHWAGIRRVRYAASSRDVMTAAGFDEGPLHPEWSKWSSKRGSDIQHLLSHQEAAVQVLQHYRDKGGEIYNA